MYPYISIFGKQTGTYGLCMLAAIVVAVLLAYKKGKPKGLLIEDLLIVGACAVGCALLGGGLLYVFVTYSPAQIWEYILAGDFSFFTGGIVFYGGLIGGVLGALLGVKLAGCGFAIVERSIVPFIPLGHAIGRIGCVLGGCCHGFPYDGPLALYYPHSVLGLSPEQGYFPVQPLESLLNIVICFLLLWFEKRMRKTTQLLFVYLGLYGVSRFFLEMLRGDAIRGIWYELSTSQIISLVLIGISIVGFCWKHKEKAPQ